MDKLLIKSEKKEKKSTVWKPVMVSEEVYNLLQEIAEETKLTKGEVATRVLTFGLEHTQVVTDEN